MCSCRLFIISSLLTAGRGTASTVFKTTFYQGSNDSSSCETTVLDIIHLGVPGENGAEPFDTCIDNNGTYTKYLCNESMATMGTYLDATCNSLMTNGTQITSDTCVNATTTTCAVTEHDYTPTVIDWAINATFYTDSSCTVPNGDESSFTPEEFFDTTDISTTCSRSNYFDYNIKLACIDGVLNTLYYETSDGGCASDPIAVGTRKQCMPMSSLGHGDYALPTCVEASSIPGGNLPSLASDEGDNMLMLEYYDSTDCDGDYMTETIGTYGVPQFGSGGFSNILSFSECMYSSDLGVYYSYTCSGSSKKVAVGYYSAYSCDFDFYTGVATLYDDSDCDSGIIGYCASTGTTYKSTERSFEVVLTYSDETMCTTTNGNEVDQTWTEFIASDIGSSAIATSDVSSSTSLSSAYSEECTYTEPYYSLVVCVSGQMKVVFYKDEYCSEDASIVYTFDECVELEYDDLGTSAALSCRFDYDTCGAGSDTFSSTDPDIGNGYCDSTLNSEDCNYDGGDCCESTCTASTYSCENYDDDTCLDPLAMYSSCDYDSVDKYYSEIGDSICDTDLNTRDCAWDGGDCCESTCEPTATSWDWCPNDDDDCLDPDVLYVCDFEAYGHDPDDANNGMCDLAINNEDCEYDGGDCCESTCGTGEYDCINIDDDSCIDPDASDYVSGDDDSDKPSLNHGGQRAPHLLLGIATTTATSALFIAGGVRP